MKNLLRLLWKSKFSILAGWIVGALVYFLGVIITGGMDGFPALICQPFMAAFVSAVFVVIVFIAGLPLFLTRLNNIWRKARMVDISLLILGYILCFHSQYLGFTDIYYYPFEKDYVGPNAWTTLLGYFLIIFSIVNWPKKLAVD
jgi:hypothetical protein